VTVCQKDEGLGERSTKADGKLGPNPSSQRNSEEEKGEVKDIIMVYEASRGHQRICGNGRRTISHQNEARPDSIKGTGKIDEFRHQWDKNEKKGKN